MEIYQIHDREKLAAYFRRDLPTHAYSLGDLDDFYWPKTTFYGEACDGQISRVTLLYRGKGLPVLLALGQEGFFGKEYFRYLSPHLPNTFYAHLSPGLEKYFLKDYDLIDYGEHYKMSLISPPSPRKNVRESCFRLNPDHITELNALYDHSYPDHAFDPTMVSTGKYFGCRVGNTLVSAAGVHVYSSRYQVAALGNITTHPDFRNQGYARRVTSCLCQNLVPEVEYVGLNVKADNAAALHIYRSLGFQISSKYSEFGLKRQF